MPAERFVSVTFRRDETIGTANFTAGMSTTLPESLARGLGDSVTITGPGTAPRHNTAAEQSAGQAMVTEYGISYTWATKPSAAGNLGKVIRISDVGTGSGGSMWISDGAYWRPLGGSVVLAQRCGAPGYPITQNTGATDFLFTLPAPVVVPANMLIPGESQMEAECWVRRVGATATASLRMYLGVNGSAASDSNLGSNTLPATTNHDCNPGPLITVQAADRIGSSGWLARHNTSGGALAGYDAQTGINIAQAMYLSIGCFNANVADTFRLIAYRLTLKQ